jgi:uncharacterized membrane protein YdjX (TVP38/TMEM64 family)
LGVLVAAICLVWILGPDKAVMLDWLRANRDALQAEVGARPVWSAVGYVVSYAAITAMSLPLGIVISLLGGFLFGLGLGAFLSVVGATCGATILFLVARSALGHGWRDRLGPRLRRFEAGFARDAASYLLFLRLVPAFPFWLVNLAPAFFSVRLWTYVWTTAVGVIPGAVVYAYAGRGLGMLLDAPVLNFRQILTPHLMAAFFLLAVLALVPVFHRLWRARRGR